MRRMAPESAGARKGGRMKVYNTKRGILVTAQEGSWHLLDVSNWDALVCNSDLQTYIHSSFRSPAIAPPAPEEILAPIGTQEVWAAGVTYFRSRNARIEESKDAGGGTFYDRIYQANRPELFFKATARRVVGPGGCLLATANGGSLRRRERRARDLKGHAEPKRHRLGRRGEGP